MPRKPPSLDVKDVGPGPVAMKGDWEVVAAPAEHVEPWLDSLADRGDTSEGSFVFTGDTRPCQTVADLSKDVDVLIFSCVGRQEQIKDTAEATYMCGTTGAGELAQQVGARKLVLVHNTRFADPGDMERGIADVARVYDGEIIMGEELMEVPL